MANKTISINTKETFRLQNTLKDMHRSALPNVVRFTMNDLAFHTKKDTLVKSADKFFITRSKNFFKANSGVVKAKGYNISNMNADVGMLKKNKASRNLKFQERGGSIPNRSFIPTNDARVSKSDNRKVSKKYHLSRAKIINANKTKTTVNAAAERKRKKERGGAAKGTSRKKSNLIAAVAKAHEIGAYVLFIDKIYDIKSFKKKGRNRVKFKWIPIYTYKKGRTVRVNKSPFLQTAAKIAAKTTDEIFKVNFDRQIAKLKSKGKL